MSSESWSITDLDALETFIGNTDGIDALPVDPKLLHMLIADLHAARAELAGRGHRMTVEFDALVAELRDYANNDRVGIGACGTIRRAADAIEELMTRVKDDHRKLCEYLIALDTAWDERDAARAELAGRDALVQELESAWTEIGKLKNRDTLRAVAHYQRKAEGLQARLDTVIALCPIGDEDHDLWREIRATATGEAK